MGECKNKDFLSFNLKVKRVRKMTQQTPSGPVFVQFPLRWRLGQRINSCKSFISECICRLHASLKIPGKTGGNFCLSIRQHEYFIGLHSRRSLVFASLHATGRMLPLRRPVLRLLISRRHASEMLGSSLPSKLSSKATTRTDRSPSGKAKASSSRWSTCAFMPRSLASTGAKTTPNRVGGSF